MEIQEMIAAARIAQAEYEQHFGQDQVDEIIRAAAHVIYDNAEMLAKITVEETEMGVYEDKVAKNRNKSKGVWYNLRGKKSMGIIGIDDRTGLIEIAKPIGVVAGITPMTNPVVTPMSKIIFALKTKNAIIIAPHPKAKVCSSLAVKLIKEAIAPFGVPENLVQVIEEPSIEKTKSLMEQCDVVVATGGMPMVKSAYSSGKPSFGVGAGNVQVILDRNIDFRPFDPEVRSSDEMELRYQMALLIRRAYKQMLFTSTEGTFAVRVDKERILITPRDVDRGNIQPEDMVLVKGMRYESGRKLSRAAWLFRAIFDAQPEINSLIIANPPHLMGYMVAHEEFDPRVIPECYILLREMPTFPFGTQFRELGKITGTLSPRYPIIMIQNDCMISSGRTLLEAFDRMEVAEYSAKATISARNLGGMKPINDEQIADLVKAFKLIP